MEHIVTTMSNYPGKKVTRVIKVVYAFDTEFRAYRSIRDTDLYIDTALENLYKKALKLGANAVLGVQLSVLDSGNPFLMGTAVVLEDE